jgi:uncharacterized protein YecT (DUF1311 family)
VKSDLETISQFNDEIIKAIVSFENKEWPKDVEFSKSDKLLNSVYSKIMKQEMIYVFGEIKKENIKSIQRKWIKYRDAWVSFSSKKYPALPQDAVKTWLTNLRIKQLEELLE